jgi:hypothetical protein
MFVPPNVEKLYFSTHFIHICYRKCGIHTYHTLNNKQMHHALTLYQCTQHSAAFQPKILCLPLQIKILHSELLTSSVQVLQALSSKYYWDMRLHFLERGYQHFGQYIPDYIASS